MMEAPLKERMASRKFILMIMILWFSILAVTFPSLLSLLGVKVGIMMTGGEFSTIIIGTFATYCSVNVWQKKIASDEENEPQ